MTKHSSKTHTLVEQTIDEQFETHVARLIKNPSEIADTVNRRRMAAALAALDLFAFASKVLDMVKKDIIYNKDTSDSLAENPLFQQTLQNRLNGHVVIPKIEDLNLLHVVMGIAGEAGELVENLLSAFNTLTPFDKGNLTEELGDLEFYIEGLRGATGVKREAVLLANIEKLKARYPAGGYSDAAAQARADKNVDNTEQLPGIPPSKLN